MLICIGWSKLRLAPLIFIMGNVLHISGVNLIYTSRSGTTCPSGASEFIHSFSDVHVAHSLVFCVVFFKSLFGLVLSVLLQFTALVTSLVSSDLHCWVSKLCQDRPLWKEKFKQWWSTTPPISTRRTVTSKQWWSTIPPISTKQTTNHWTQKRTAYDDGNSRSWNLLKDDFLYCKW